MQWLELSVQVPPELVEPVVNLFQRYGKETPVIEEPGGFNPDEGEGPSEDALVAVRTYLPAGKRASRRQARIEVGFRLLSLIRPLPPLQARHLTAQEWEEAWKAYFRPLRIGQRLVVCPQGQEYTPHKGDVAILLDPGLAFGTGYHPTTQMCLEEVERRVRPDFNVLDLGTGSGILALAAAKLGASRVLALDVDPQSLRAARRNIRLNGLSRVVRVTRGTLPREEATGFHLVLANISASVLMELADFLVSCLVSTGVLVASGFLEERGDEVRQAFARSGLQVLETQQREDWLVLIAQRP